jgi:hypothetical protein
VRYQPIHADAAVFNSAPDLLEQFITGGALPTVLAYRGLRTDLRPKTQATLDVMVRKGRPWRLGTQALVFVMHRLNAPQMVYVLSKAPSHFNREKLLAAAIRCGNEDVARTVAQYGFGTRVTARVALRTLAKTSIRSCQYQGLADSVTRLAQMHRDTRSEPLQEAVVRHLLRWAVRRYFDSFIGYERERSQWQSQFLRTFEEIVSLADRDRRFNILSQARRDFVADWDRSPEAGRIREKSRTFIASFQAFVHFKVEFESYLDSQINPVAALAGDELPYWDGPSR